MSAVIEYYKGESFSRRGEEGGGGVSRWTIAIRPPSPIPPVPLSFAFILFP